MARYAAIDIVPGDMIRVRHGNTEVKHCVAEVKHQTRMVQDKPFVSVGKKYALVEKPDKSEECDWGQKMTVTPIFYPVSEVLYRFEGERRWRAIPEWMTVKL
jgi:hypothetical protein